MQIIIFHRCKQKKGGEWAENIYYLSFLCIDVFAQTFRHEYFMIFTHSYLLPLRCNFCADADIFDAYMFERYFWKFDCFSSLKNCLLNLEKNVFDRRMLWQKFSIYFEAFWVTRDWELQFLSFWVTQNFIQQP